jgi:hypothetical protein
MYGACFPNMLPGVDSKDVIRLGEWSANPGPDLLKRGKLIHAKLIGCS